MKETMVPEAQLALVLLGVFWAGTSAVFTGIKNRNEVRDKIVLGHIGGDELPVEYLWRVLFLDWMPLKFALAVISLVLAAVILMLPRIGTPSASFASICRVAAAFPILGGSFEVVSFGFELRYLMRQIRKHAGRNDKRDRR